MEMVAVYFKRDISSAILKISAEYPVILLTGARQVGKTTMLKNIGEPRHYVSLDDAAEMTLAREDPVMFFQIHKPPVLIDEVQYAPQLFPRIKKLVDDGASAGDFWLTGSQIFKTLGGVRESLAGRVALLNLFPLTQNEIYRNGSPSPYKNDLELLSERQNSRNRADVSEIYRRIFAGGMPALVSGKYSDVKVFYSSYIGTYIERDVREISSGADSLKFLKFITAAACRCSQLVNYADIARDADIDQTTAKNWLRILEALGIIFFLQPYSSNILKRVVKTPKMYFHDSGLVSFLTKWNSPETLESGAMSGAILENYVIGEIYKSRTNALQVPNFYYYRDKDMKEIDLIIEEDGEFFPIEIKKTASPDKRMIGAFKTLKTQRGTGALICMADALSAFDSQNLIVPVWLI